MGCRILAVFGLGAVLLSLAAPPVAAAPPAGGPRSALVIGISRHAGNKPAGTVGGANDVAVVRDALRQAGWRDDEMMVLVDGAATAGRIREGFRWLQARSTESSFTFFHYSGHTFQRAGDLDRDGEVLDEFLVPYDARNLISDREFSEQLQQVRGWTWANIANCEAAGFDEGGLSGPRRLVTSSSAESEKSYERPDWKMSVFVGLMFDQGISKGKADEDRNGVVSIQEAFGHAASGAPAMTARQSKGPQHPQIAGGDGTAWFLQAPPAAAPPARPPADQRPPGLCLILC